MWEPGLTNPQCPLRQEARGECRDLQVVAEEEGHKGYGKHLNAHKKTWGYIYANVTAPGTAALAFSIPSTARKLCVMVKVGRGGLHCSEPQTGVTEDEVCKAFSAKALGLTLTSVG